MCEDEFKIILKQVKEWLEKNSKKPPFTVLKFDQVINNDKCLRVIFENSNCVGEVIVEQPECAPYRFVKIEILSLRDNDNKLIYAWYDKENDKCEYIISQLQKGLTYALAYC